MGRDYAALTVYLRQCGEPVVELTFAELDQIVIGGLPDSAKQWAAWWANSYSSQPHARYWLDAGRRARPDFNRQSVQFEVGAATPPRPETSTRSGGSPRKREPAELKPTGEINEGTISFEWLHAGPVSTDGSGKLKMPQLPQLPGVYRFNLHLSEEELAGVYVGESDNLHRRMSTYRNPAPTQPTNIRMNDRLLSFIAVDGQRAEMAVVLEATLRDETLNLKTKPARLLVENLALLDLASRSTPTENL